MLITKEELDLIPPSVKRRMTDKDFQLLDDIIHNNKRFGVEMGFDEYFDVNLHDSLHEFIQYKVAEIDPNLGDDSWDREENNTYVIFRKLFPFLNEKYHDDLYEYYMEKNRRHRNINESKENLYNLIEGTLVDFINYYIIPEIDPNLELDDDESDDEWDKAWELYTKLVPFLKKKYGSDKDLQSYYKINHQ